MSVVPSRSFGSQSSIQAQNVAWRRSLHFSFSQLLSMREGWTGHKAPGSPVPGYSVLGRPQESLLEARALLVKPNWSSDLDPERMCFFMCDKKAQTYSGRPGDAGRESEVLMHHIFLRSEPETKMESCRV